MPENGPGENFTDLHNRLYGKVFSFVHMRIKDKEEVKDIVQDVFIRAYNSWVKTKGQLPDENTARNFLYVIAKQRMIDLWRSSRSRFQTDLLNKDFDEDSEENNWNDFDQLASDEPLPQELFEKNENANLVLDLLNRLKREEREILILRFLDELEYKELSRIYKTTEDNVRQKVSRALQNLKKVAKKNS